jgi:diguanylate cyclase
VAAIIQAHISLCWGAAMEFSHTFDRADELAGQALQRMREMTIAPHPNNYAIWYSYCSGDVPDLNDVPDALVDNRHEFNDERNQTLYRKFFASAVDVLPIHLIAEKVEAELSAVLGALETTAGTHAKYGESLERVGEFAEGITQPQALRRLLTAIIEKTRAVARQSCELEGQLRQSWREVGLLREQLESAKREAMTDALTGLANRKMLDFVLRRRRSRPWTRVIRCRCCSSTSIISSSSTTPTAIPSAIMC